MGALNCLRNHAREYCFSIYFWDGGFRNKTSHLYCQENILVIFAGLIRNKSLQLDYTHRHTHTHTETLAYASTYTLSPHLTLFLTFCIQLVASLVISGLRNLFSSKLDYILIIIFSKLPQQFLITVGRRCTRRSKITDKLYFLISFSVR